VCPSEAREEVGRTITVSQAMAEIEKDIIFYDQSGGGVTFSGGEPLMQQEFLLGLLKTCRKKEISTAIDTSGYAPWEFLQTCAADVDLFLYDLKLMDDEKHIQYTDVSNKLILSNLKELTRIHNNVIVRFPVIPGITDSHENIISLGNFLSNLNIKGIELLPYHKIGIEKYARLNMEYSLAALEPPSEEELNHVRNTLQSYHLNIIKGRGNRDERKS
jgi:pyruvate formate lyase activating enzyme